MPQYAIMRFQKHKGGASGRLESHHERKKESYASNPDIDTTKSKNNFHIIQPQNNYRQETDERIAVAGCKTRKDSVRFVDTLVTASPAFFKGRKLSEIKAYFECAVDFLSRKIGRDNIFTAVVHMDEKTPHMHLCFTPITADGRLSAKDIIGNKAQLIKWQDDFFAHMVSVYPDLERGESASETGRRHIPTSLFKQSVNLSKEAEQIKRELSEINPLNASKKRDNASSMLEKWFPKMEKLDSKMKKYQRSIDLLEKENAELSQKAKYGNESKVKTQLEIGKLKSEVQELHKFIDFIPEDIKLELKKQQKKSKSTSIETI